MVLIIIAAGEDGAALIFGNTLVGFPGNVDRRGFGMGSAADLDRDVPEAIGGKGDQHSGTAVGVLPGKIADVVIAGQQDDTPAPDLAAGFCRDRIDSRLEHILVIETGAEELCNGLVCC